jgi:hypothetical protein
VREHWREDKHTLHALGLFEKRDDEG